MAVPALATSGCGRQARGRLLWEQVLAWDTGVTRGQLSDGRPVGPLAVAAGADTVALADTFSRRVLVWRRGGRGFEGPAAVSLPAASGVTDVALTAGTRAVYGFAADGDGTVWRWPHGGAPAVWTRLGPAADELQVVSGLAVTAGGVPVADLTTVTRHEASRRLLNLSRPAPETIASASIARAVRDGSPTPSWLLPPTGARRSLAGGDRGVWVLGRHADGTGAVLAEVSLQGRVLTRRPFPSLGGPLDLLGVHGGRAYALAATGTARARVVAVDRHGRVASDWYLKGGGNAGVPELPHPAALGPSGEILVLSAETEGVRLRLFSSLPV